MATNTKKQGDPWEMDFMFLRCYRYISLFCPLCEGEFNLNEAGQIMEHEDYEILSSPDTKDTVNLVCPECGHPHLEVILGV